MIAGLRGATRVLVLAAIVMWFAPHPARADALTQAIRKFVSIGGFADVNLVSSNRQGTSVQLSELDVYATGHFSENWSAQIEAIAVKDAEVSTLAEPILERFYLGYARSDAFRLEFGQIHTGIVQWNEREHRSRFLQTPMDVPGIARREDRDGAWPLHLVGVWVSGRLNDRLGLTYGAGVGNGRGRDRGDIANFSLHHPARAQLLVLGIAPESLREWSFSAAAYFDHIPASTPLRERDLTLSTSFVRGNHELRAEWSVMHHELMNGQAKFSSRGWYVLLSERLRGRWRATRPYLLIDRLNLDQREEYLGGAANEQAVAIGLRWDPLRWFTWKTDFRSQNSQDGGREHLVRMQLAFSF